MAKMKKGFPPSKGQEFGAPPAAPAPVLNPKAKKKLLSRMGPDVNNLEATILKEAVEPVVKGGPGSGVGWDNTAPFKLPQSPHVSVGTRKGMLENMASTVEEIPMDKITHVGQTKYVPAKLTSIMKDYDKVMKKPVSVLKVKDEYHVIDGHHRYLAAKINGENTIKANVYVKAGSESVEKGGPGSGPQGGKGEAAAVSISDHQPQPKKENDGTGPKQGGEMPKGIMGTEGTDLHSTNHTKESGLKAAKELRANGKFANIWHVGGPKSGPRSNYIVTTFKDVKKSADASTADDADPRIAVGQGLNRTPNDLLLAIEALGYSWSDSTTSGKANRSLGYPSQGGLVRKEDEDDMIDEHERLVDVLEEGDEDERKEEARIQAKELAGMKRDKVAKSSLTVKVPIFKADQRKQIVYGVVLTPDEEDLQGDVITAEEIEKTAHEYIAKSRVVGANHEKQMNACVVESFIAPEVMKFDQPPYGKQIVNKGAWVIGIKVNDPKEWQKIESGEYTGFSVGGMGLRDKLN